MDLLSLLCIRSDWVQMFLETCRPDLDPAKNNYTFVGWDGGVDSQNPFSVIEGVKVSQRRCGVKHLLTSGCAGP